MDPQLEVDRMRSEDLNGHSEIWDQSLRRVEQMPVSDC
jgi:hypothetical protein